MRDIALSRVLAAAALIWAGALILGAFIASRPQVGPVAYFISAAIYEVGSLVCHQRPERSFHLWGAQLAVCARCAGIYLGAAVAGLAAVSMRVASDRDPVMKDVKRAVLFAALPTALTLFYEWTTAQMPGNWTRAAAGFPLGAIVAWIIVAISAPSSAVEVH